MSNTELFEPLNSSTEDVPSGFVFEEEHPQIKLPFSAFVCGRRMEGESLSLTKAELSGLLAPGEVGTEELISLRFDFDGFSITLYSEAFVSKSGDSENATVELRFSNPTGEHLAPLRYILNSHIAGHVVSMGQLLGFTGPVDVKPTPPKVQQSLANRLMMFARMGLVFGLSTVLVYSAVTIVYQRVAYQYEAHPVTITREGELMRATSAGQITFVNPTAVKGDVVYSIAANSGELLSVRMPCDCNVLALAGFKTGATVLAGDEIVKLTDETAALAVVTQISDGGVARMIAGDQPELELTSGAVVPVSLEFEGGGPAGQVRATLTLPQSAAGVAQAGDAARLRFRNRFLDNWIAPIFGFLQAGQA